MRWLAVLLLAACVEEKPDTGAAPVPPWETDDDGDDYTADVDCDDHDAGVHPGADERCDGVDQDCDEQVDEDAVDAPTWYADGDDDGYGDATTWRRSCEPIDGWLSEAGDCDDDDAEVRPGAEERCDGRDEDCDGEVDEGDPADSPTWYRDADGDGYGQPGDTTVSCPQPDGYAPDATDCDDTDAGIHPDAPEVCDGVDEDCDGSVDDAPVDGEPWYADGDGDGWGDPVSAMTWCPSTAPAGWVERGRDCDDGDASISPDGVEVCDGVDQDCDGSVDEDAVDAPAWYGDGDGDGFGAGAPTWACEAPTSTSDLEGDCDDADVSVYPGAPEYCDGADTDCDGTDDEGDALDAATWYADADGDGYGAAAAAVAACEAPVGYVADATDCDDGDAGAWPGAPEYCDTVDTDCDGVVDEDDALDAPTWYLDADADGYGDASAARPACAAPTGYAASPEDCDDGDATVSPGLAETCDGRDDDCDGTVDEDDAVDAPTWYLDADADGYGDPTTGRPACAAPSGYVAADTDCDDADPFAAPGRPEICDDGADNDCDGTDNGCVRVGEIDLRDVYHARVLGTSTGDLVGAALGYAGDVDGDGVGDLVVGAPGVGEAWVFNGVPYGDLSVYDTDAALVGSVASETGSAVAGLGDFDGDGLGDAVVGGPGLVGGAAWVVFGAWNTVEVVANADLTLSPEGFDDHLGASVASAGDLDGDGLADLVVGAYEADGAATDSGAAYVILGGASGDLDVASADGVLYGGSASARLGYAVAGVGDVDGDGLDDVLVGAPSDRTAALLAGAAYLVRGPATGTYATGDADAAFLGVSSTDFAGTSVAAAGDTDGDGQRELIVGGTHADGGATDAGAAWLLRGPFAGTSSLADAAAVFYGVDAGEQAGNAVAGVGDFDHDGFDDLAVGARLDDDAAHNAGVVYLLYGPGPWSTSLADAETFFQGPGASYAGTAVVGRPESADLSGDGVPDFLVGAPYDASSGFASGGAYVVPGRGL